MSMIKNYQNNNLYRVKAIIHGLKLYLLHLLKIKKEPEIKILKSINLKNTVAIDIGANGADWTLSLSDMVGSKGLVLGFEPHPYFYIATKFAILYSLKKNIQLFKLGIGSENKLANLLIISNSNQLNYRSRISENKINNNLNKTETIKIKKLDYFKNFSNKKLSIIKIDVEGYESEVIKGALITINRFHPIIIFEINSNSKGRENFEKIKDLLANYEYKFLFISRKNKLVECKNFNQIIDTKSKNIIAWTSLSQYSLKSLKKFIYKK